MRWMESQWNPQDERIGSQARLARLALWGYVVFVALLAATVIRVGPVAQNTFTHDFFSIVEGSWKIVQGFHIYTDFNTIIGPLPYLMVALGILLDGPVADAMPLSIALTLLPVALLAWSLLSPRYSVAGRFCIAAYLALLWCAPYPLHFSFFIHAYAMMYNRQAYVLLSLLFLSMAVQPRKNPLLKGILLGLLFFIKIPYFVVGIGFLVFYLFLSKVSFREISWGVAGFLISFLPVFLYLGLSGTETMFVFLFEAGHNRTPDVLASSLDLLRKEFPFVLTVTLLLAICARQAARQGHPGTPFLPDGWQDRLHVLAEPFVVLFGALLTETASSPLMMVIDIPLIVAYVFLTLERLPRTPGVSLGLPSAWARWAALALALLILLPMGTRPIGAVADTVLQKTFPLRFPIPTHFDAVGVSDLQAFDRCSGYPPHLFYVAKINDGIYLLERHKELRQAVVATLDFSDPFSFSLQRHSPPHMPVGLQYGYVVTETVAPDPAFIFGGCQAIMVPTYPDDPVRTFEILDAKYHDYLAQHFVLADQSPQWKLFRRVR